MIDGEIGQWILIRSRKWHLTGKRRTTSRSASNDSLLDDDDDDDDDDPRMPNKDFRKSELNRARHYFDDPHDPDVFEREPSPPDMRRQQRHRRQDSYGKDPVQVGYNYKSSSTELIASYESGSINWILLQRVVCFLKVIIGRLC